MSYGKVVRKIRASQPTKNGKIMSYADFSKITGISAAQLERLEKEQSNPPVMKLKPTIDSLKRLCDNTHYPFRQFLEEAGYIEPIKNSPIDIEELKERFKTIFKNISPALSDVNLPKEQADLYLSVIDKIFEQICKEHN